MYYLIRTISSIDYLRVRSPKNRIFVKCECFVWLATIVIGSVMVSDLKNNLQIPFSSRLWARDGAYQFSVQLARTVCSPQLLQVGQYFYMWEWVYWNGIRCMFTFSSNMIFLAYRQCGPPRPALSSSWAPWLQVLPPICGDSICCTLLESPLTFLCKVDLK